MVTIGCLDDSLIGRFYAQGEKAVRAVNFGLFASCHDLDEGENWRLVYITDRGKFYGLAQFVGASNFNIIDVLLVDYNNQLVYRLNRKMPIVVEPGKVVNLGDYSNA